MTPKFGILLLLSVLGLPAYCEACDCVDLPMDRSYSLATHVFYGRVVEAKRDKSNGLQTTFEVSRWWKAGRSKSSRITLSARGTDCDLTFEVGQKWLVFAQGNPLTATLCNGSALLEDRPSNSQAPIR